MKNESDSYEFILHNESKPYNATIVCWFMKKITLTSLSFLENQKHNLKNQSF